jgi:Leucine-rich repeat (LRR) protein
LEIQLERLYLDHNSINEIQSGIKNCKYLKKLDLSYNNIQNLPKNEFSNLESLTFIDLSKNPVSEELESSKKILNAKELDEFLNKSK